MSLPSAASSAYDSDANRRRKNLGRAVLLCTGLVGLLVGFKGLLRLHGHVCGGNVNGIWDALDQTGILDISKQAQDLCPQADELSPVRNKAVWDAFNSQLSTDEFKTKAINWLSGSVKIPTPSFDKMDPVGVDPRWEAFAPFHEYLEESFPLIHSKLSLTKVNTYGLVYEWEGSDPSLKPLLLAAHQDVVPVDPRTVDEWEHPPFSGFYDGERIWGRGSNDDKSGLIGIMSTIETLVKADFQPTRKVVLASGFDEETSGLHGAHEIGKYLESTYGEDAFAMLVDEGGGYSEQFGGIFAVPAIGEKGYIDTRVEVSTPGGHSSIPPSHTSIGILSSLLVAYESNPMKPTIDRTTPIYGMMQCLAEHAPSMDKSLRKIILKSTNSDKTLHKLEGIIEDDLALRSFVGTTQAIDLIQGGVKTNALPEQAWAVINHRIATQGSVEAVKERDTKVIVELAEKFNLTYNAFGQTLLSGGSGSLTLSDAWGTALEPAPVTPIDAAPYKLLSGTIRSAYAVNHDEDIKIAPGIMTGNTDTRYYWNLTKHIFRYNHNHNMFAGGRVGGGVHTVNEVIVVDDFLEMIRFFSTLILNADEYEL
ncbi:carboxypeptidase S [Fomitiporia mediterranea MF3/22]|uniref:carboxypeptidase S n=1 Tax=Fomitiporia mediterranea (strain MF3/22) TaxID=694068 RepID=UPI0004409A6D|nr:carboxypeptidase S [Fomitiporia mediterranea MF3/22]EJD07407.1 carboxypeptidase S [Fomitiporia mediterranea MF3/22]